MTCSVGRVMRVGSLFAGYGGLDLALSTRMNAEPCVLALLPRLDEVTW